MFFQGIIMAVNSSDRRDDTHSDGTHIIKLQDETDSDETHMIKLYFNLKNLTSLFLSHHVCYLPYIFQI